MKKAIAKKWVEALRSGTYQKGINYLRMENEFCCLGVLCDISKQSNWEENSNGYPAEYDEIRTHLSPRILKWANMKSSNSHILAIINDYNAENFNEIADYIEDYWPQL